MGTAAPAAGGGAPAAGATAQTASSAGLSDNAASALCYVLGLLTGIIFLVQAPYNQNKLVRFHAFQSIFLNVAWFAAAIAVSIVGVIMTSISWALGAMFGLVSMVIHLGFLVLVIYVIVKAVQGSKVVLPVVGPLAAKQA
jgi:uncharacterized membrane protein